MPVTSAVSCVPQRWVVCALCSLACAIISYKNFCFYAIADIVDSTSEKKKKPSGGCPFLFSGSSWERKELTLVLPDFYWNPNMIDIAYSAFCTGKILTVVPAGMLSDFGFSRYVLGGGMLLVAVDHLLLLTFAKLGITVFVVQNILDGASEAMIFPSIFTLISRWAPTTERNLFTAFVVVGYFYGDNLGHIFFKLFFIGFRSWRIGNFITGTFALMWLAFGFIFIHHSPNGGPLYRRDFSITTSGHRRKAILIGLKRLKGIPWLKIMSSRAFLSLVLAYCSVDWVAYENIWDSFATYQKYILHLPEKFSDMSSIIVFAVIPSSLMGGLFADWINKHDIMSKTAVKKTFAFISVFLSSILQLSAILAGCNIMLFWILSITAAYILGLANPVIYSTPIDLCSRHAGLMMAIMTGARSICAVFSLKLSDILTDGYNSDQWRNKYLVCSILTLALIVPFLFFGSGKEQQWRCPSPRVTRPDSVHPLDPLYPRNQAEEPKTSEESNLPPATP